MKLLDHHLRTTSSNNRQPWMPVFASIRSAERRLNDRIALIEADPDRARGRGVSVMRLKANLGTRRMVLPETEAEIAMGRTSCDLVKALEGARVPISWATRVRNVPGHDLWHLEPFLEQRGNFKTRAREIANSHDFVLTTDIQQFFDSMDMGRLLRECLALSGLPEALCRHPLMILSAHATTHRRLPIGPELASVLGNAVLTDTDRFLRERVGEEAAARWVDDMTIGVDSESRGWELVEDLKRGPIENLGLTLHPLKTRVEPSEDWSLGDLSFIDGDADALGRRGVLLSRSQARADQEALLSEGKDPELTAVGLASGLGAAACDSAWRIRRMAKLAPEAESVGEAAVKSLATRVKAGYSDDIAEAFLTLAEKGIALGKPASEMVVAVACSSDVPQRTRGAAAWLLSSTGTFDKRILDQLDSMRHYGARAVLGAASLAGHVVTDRDVAAAIN